MHRGSHNNNTRRPIPHSQPPDAQLHSGHAAAQSRPHHHLQSALAQSRVVCAQESHRPQRLHDRRESRLHPGGAARHVRRAVTGQRRAQLPETRSSSSHNRSSHNRSSISHTNNHNHTSHRRRHRCGHGSRRLRRLDGADASLRRDRAQNRPVSAVEKGRHQDPHHAAADRRQSCGQVHAARAVQAGAGAAPQAPRPVRLRAGRRREHRSVAADEGVLRPVPRHRRAAEAHPRPLHRESAVGAGARHTDRCVALSRRRLCGRARQDVRCFFFCRYDNILSCLQ